jgi:adenosylcobinamide-GDP ribazoletransferase
VVRLNGLPPWGPFAALQFLTRIPIRLRRAPSMSGLVVWFPVAGAVIGTLVGGAGAGLWHAVPPLVAGAVAVAVGLLVTGAFHEDGLGDIADAFGGGYTLERRLEIMKDSRHGTYGVAAMCASIVVRVVALGSMPSGVHRWKLTAPLITAKPISACNAPSRMTAASCGSSGSTV